MPLEAAIILGVLVAALVSAVIFIIKAVRGAAANQKVSEEQKRIRVGQWYALGKKSKRRRNRVRSQLPVSKPGAQGADEAFVWVTGLTPARFWFLMVPVLLAIPLVVYLWVMAADLYAHPYIISGSGMVSGTLKLNNLGGFMLSLIAFLVLPAACVYAVIVYLKWSGKYVVLSNYRVYLVRIYPSWAFWMESDGAIIELKDLSFAGVKRSTFGKAFGYGALRLDTPGKADDAVVNLIRYIPNAHLRILEIIELQRALPPQQRTETDRVVKAMNDGFDRVVQKLDEKLAPYSPAQEPSGEDEADDTADSEETQEVTQVES